MKRDAFETWSLAELNRIVARHGACVPADAPAGLGDAMRYAVLDGGKRLRPLLVLAAANTVHGDHGAALRAACAVELIHAYSLVHDDLPCMNDDVLRRGKPTVHVRYGVAQAMLAGDAMQRWRSSAASADAVAPPAGTLCGLPAPPAAPAWPAARLSTSPASACRSVSRACRTCTEKTGALLQASVLMGAACGRPRRRVAGAGRYGR